MRTDSQRHFIRGLRKYGPEAFEWEWLGTLESWDEGCDAERFFIAKGWTYYNETDGGDGLCNPSPEVRKKMSDSMKTSPKAVAQRATLWEVRRSNTSSDELSRIMSEAQSNMTPEQNAQKSQKLRESMAARTPEQEADRQRKRAETIAKRTPEQTSKIGRNISKGVKERILSEEAQRKIDAGAKKGGHTVGQLMKARLEAMSTEEKSARSANLSIKITAACAARTPEQKAEITRKRLETRARNKAAKLAGGLP